jgi:S-adenosylmethionine:tRNA ribosyltransferase-isomerase
VDSFCITASYLIVSCYLSEPVTDPRLLPYDYHLPSELIATYPLEERDASRLLFVNGCKNEDRTIKDVVDILSPGDLLIFNNTKVLNARVSARRKTGGVLEILFLTENADNDGQYSVLIKPSRRLKINEIILVNCMDEVIQIKLKKYSGEGEWSVEVFGNVSKMLDTVGRIPIPPYLNREADEKDQTRYQTIFAGPKGAVAAPTAGLHISPGLLGKILQSGILVETITLHVGIGTFRNLRSTDLDSGRLHREYFSLSKQTAETIRNTKSNGGKIIAVGTTVTRCLESVFVLKGDIQNADGYTDIFIQEGFSFKVIDGLLTNFHLPRTSLLMLVCAFGGRKRVLDAYEHAVSSDYRFFSYGDAMLLL